MTEKNIFVNKLFFLLNTSDFSLFFMLKLPLEKITSLFPTNLLLFLKIWLEVHSPSPTAESVGRAHYEPIDSDIKKDLKK